MALHFAIVRTNDQHPEDPVEVLLAQDVCETLVTAAFQNARFGSKRRSAKRVRRAFEQAKHELHEATIALP